MSNFAIALKAELRELERSLAADPRYRRIGKLRELLAEYEPAVPVHVVGTVGTAPDLGQATRKVTRAPTKASKVKKALAAFMAAQARPVSRQEMLAHLESKHLLGSETKPMKRLAIYLTQARSEELFDTDGRGNWFLSPRVTD